MGHVYNYRNHFPLPFPLPQLPILASIVLSLSHAVRAVNGSIVDALIQSSASNKDDFGPEYIKHLSDSHQLIPRDLINLSETIGQLQGTARKS